jgi:CBS domain-containing protein
MQALELMRSHIVKTRPEDTLKEAVDLMDLYQVTGLPVVDAEGRLIGMLTECDVARALVPEGRLEILEGNDAASLWESQCQAGRCVGDFMSQPAISVDEATDIRAAAELMFTHHLKRLPVTTREGQVVGMLSRVDICQAILEGSL